MGAASPSGALPDQKQGPGRPPAPASDPSAEFQLPQQRANLRVGSGRGPRGVQQARVPGGQAFHRNPGVPQRQEGHHPTSAWHLGGEEPGGPPPLRGRAAGPGASGRPRGDSGALAPGPRGPAPRDSGGEEPRPRRLRAPEGCWPPAGGRAVSCPARRLAPRPPASCGGRGRHVVVGLRRRRGARAAVTGCATGSLPAAWRRTGRRRRRPSSVSRRPPAAALPVPRGAGSRCDERQARRGRQMAES